MRIFFSCLLAVVCAASTTVAHADTVSFASSPASTTFFFGGNNAPAVAYTNAAYAAPLPGSSFVSTTAAGGNGTLDTMNFSTSFTLLANEAYTGTVSFLADDFVSVFVNGLDIYDQPFSPTGNNYKFATTVNLLPSYFHSGSNTIRFALANVGGPTALDFAGSVTGTAVTPEPSSLMLLGTGVLGLAGAVRRRFRVA